MGKFKFNPKQSIIICHVEIIGPKKELSLKMALDTGATYTMVPVESALIIGCDTSQPPHKIEITTGSSVEYVSLITIPKFRAFGVEIANMQVICHNLPPQSPVDGLIGLNFLKSAKIIIDFSKDIITTPD